MGWRLIVRLVDSSATQVMWRNGELIQLDSGPVSTAMVPPRVQSRPESSPWGVHVGLGTGYPSKGPVFTSIFRIFHELKFPLVRLVRLALNLKGGISDRAQFMLKDLIIQVDTRSFTEMLIPSASSMSDNSSSRNSRGDWPSFCRA